MPDSNATLVELVAKVANMQAGIATMKTNYDESLDTIWMMLAALLVFYMHAGFSFVESGCVRYKNTQNILAKNLIVITGGFLCWYVLGWTFAYGVAQDPSRFGGSTEAFMDGFWDDKTKFRNWFFQGVFCATSGTIVSGAMAERTQLKGFAIFIMVLTSIIYPIVAYWGWSGEGWLNYTQDGESQASTGGPAYKDFAGSGIVHLVGGVCGLCGAAIVGPRFKRFDSDDSTSFRAHNIPFVVLGTFFLWFGWYGFNPGSTLAMHDVEAATTASLVAVNTTMAPAIAGLIVFIIRAVVIPPKLLDVGGFCNGILAGLVSITAGCNVVKPWEALIIGAVGGLIYQGCSMLMVKLKVDDVVDAIAVHGACGAWGIIAIGFFGDPDEGIGGNGVFYGGNQLGTQLLGALAIIAWSALTTVIVLLPLKMLGILRIPDEEQEAGADTLEHFPPTATKARGISEDLSSHPSDKIDEVVV